MNDSASVPRKTAKIVVCYSVFLALAVFTCFRLGGAQTFIEYASWNRPYAVVLHPYRHEGVSSGSASVQGTKEHVIFFFGDSNSFYPPDWSTNTGNTGIHMAALLQDAMRAKDVPTEVTDCAFLGASMFDYYCMYYWAIRESPELIVVPINWRALGDTAVKSWYVPQLSAFVPLADELPKEYENPLKFRNISKVEQLQYKADILSLYPAGIRQWALTNLKNLSHRRLHTAQQNKPETTRAIKTDTSQPTGAAETQQKFRDLPKPTDREKWTELFPMKITSANPTFRTLCALAHIASKHDVKILFFIWPLDTESLEAAGALDRSALDLSRSLIIQSVEKEGSSCADLSDLVPHSYFYDANCHFTVEGRRIVADALAPHVISLLKKIEPLKTVEARRGFLETARLIFNRPGTGACPYEKM